MPIRKNELRLKPRPNPRLLSLVIPLFNEEESVPELRRRLTQFMADAGCPVEVVLVSDGSFDRTSQLMFDWAQDDERVRAIEFSRNFGHQMAITAGLDFADGDAVVVMDGDLQDPPELILKMLEHYREGYDVIFAQRTQRAGEGLYKRLSARGFYWFMRTFVDAGLPANTGDFRLMERGVVNALNHMREGSRFIRGMTTWMGFPQIAIPFARPAREAGETKFPTRKMIRFAWDAILSFSGLPIRIAAYTGVLICFASVLFGAASVLRKILYNDVVPGWASIVTLVSLLGGANLLFMGLLGEYISRVYNEIKQRPLYIVRDFANVDPKRIPQKAAIPTPNSRISRPHLVEAPKTATRKKTAKRSKAA